MGLYDERFKREVIDFYLSHNCGYKYLSSQFGISNDYARNLIHLYETFGYEGLKKRVKKCVYPIELKEKIISLYFEGNTLRALAKEYKIRYKSIISNWLRQYKKDGILAHSPKMKGLQAMTQEVSYDFSKPDSAKTREELLAELNYLRAEIEFTKKWNALMKKRKQEQLKKEKKLLRKLK